LGLALLCALFVQSVIESNILASNLLEADVLKADLLEADVLEAGANPQPQSGATPTAKRRNPIDAIKAAHPAAAKRRNPNRKAAQLDASPAHLAQLDASPNRKAAQLDASPAQRIPHRSKPAFALYTSHLRCG
jgi:hypothetical protein